MQVLVVTQKLYESVSTPQLTETPLHLYLSVISRVEPDATIEKSPFHVLVVCWRDVQPEGSST
jgi:hypothetical protein